MRSRSATLDAPFAAVAFVLAIVLGLTASVAPVSVTVAALGAVVLMVRSDESTE